MNTPSCRLDSHPKDEPQQGISLRDWEQAMRKGMAAARAGQPAQARKLCLRALTIAHALLSRSVRAEPVDDKGHDDRLAAFVVTHLNLADLYRDDGNSRAARVHLCIAHRTLTTLMNDAAAPLALQQLACRHLRETYAALLKHVAAHGPHPDIQAALGTPVAIRRPPQATVH